VRHQPPATTTLRAAPEVLLSGGRYKTSVDVWSVGCILAELLLRRPLFPGDNYLHQLQLITQFVGSPTEDDLHFVTSDAARAFMAKLPRYEPVSVAATFPHVRGPCLDLLARMLVFDPSKRITVDDALAHPFLARVRAARRHVNEEGVPVPRPFKLRIPGGSAGLRSMSVEAIKARFVAELCGLITPTPSAAPLGALFDGAADVVALAAAAATAAAGASCADDEDMAGVGAGRATTAAGGDEAPAEWRTGRSAGRGVGPADPYDPDDDGEGFDGDDDMGHGGGV